MESDKPKIHRAGLPLFGLLLFLLCYSLNSRLVTGGDTLAHLYVAWSVWETGDFDLSEFEDELQSPQGELPYFIVEDEGRLRTIFSFSPGVLLAPAGMILDMVGASSVTGWAWAGKVFNVFLSGGAGIFLWLLLRLRTSSNFAVFMALAFCLATPLWALSMSYLQHQPSIFFQFAALYLLMGQEEEHVVADRWRLIGAGICIGLAVLARYQVGLVAVPLALLLAWLLRTRWRDWLFFASGAALPAICLLLYNRLVVGSFLDVGYVVYPWATLGAPFLTTGAGLFINPSKGLLIHSPWMIFAVAGLWQTGRALWRRDPISPLLLIAAVTPWPLVFLYANYTGWFGGWSWGYRFLMDVLPQMTLLAAFGAWQAWQHGMAWRLVCTAMVVAGTMVQAVGALAWDNTWHARHDLGTMPHQDWLWQSRNAQPLWYVRRGAIYLGERKLALREDPFATRGLYTTEQWGDQLVAWTQPEGASFYLAVREHPLTLRFFPSNSARDSLRVTILVNGEEAVNMTVTEQEWQAVELPQIPFQHTAVITIRTDRSWREPGENGREVGVAVVVQQ